MAPKEAVMLTKANEYVKYTATMYCNDNEMLEQQGLLLREVGKFENREIHARISNALNCVSSYSLENTLRSL